MSFTVHADAAFAANMGFNGVLHEHAERWQILGNGYRVYSPVLMRFHGVDDLSPFGDGGINAYAYCGNNPVNFVDPSGHFFLAPALILGASGVGVGVGALIAKALGDEGAANVLGKISLGLSIGAAVTLGGFMFRKALGTSARYGSGNPKLQPQFDTPPTNIDRGEAFWFKSGNTHVIQVHGVPGGISHHGKVLNGTQFAKRLQQSLGEEPVTRFQLQACYGANLGRASTGQQIANFTRRPVEAIMGRPLNPGMSLTRKAGYMRTFMPQSATETRRNAALNRLAHAVFKQPLVWRMMGTRRYGRSA